MIEKDEKEYTNENAHTLTMWRLYYYFFVPFAIPINQIVNDEDVTGIRSID